MEQKTSLVVEIKLDEQGRGEARIATLQARDADGDVLMPGLLGGQEQVVPLVPAHQWTEAPLGKASVFERGRELIAGFQLNMKLGRARAWYEHLKFDLETPPSRQAWSFAFRVLEGGAERGMFEGQPVRFLKRVQLLEVSPVLVAASVNTATLALKGDLATRTAEVVRDYERLLTKIVVGDYERLREKAQGQHAYRYVKLWASDEPHRTARSAAKRGAAELNVRMPEITVFIPCELKDADFTNDVKIMGFAHPGGWEIGIRADLTDERSIAWIAAHEVRHLVGGSESEADEFADAFVHKAFVLKAFSGEPDAAPRRSGSWTGEQLMAVAQQIRGLGI